MIPLRHLTHDRIFGWAPSVWLVSALLAWGQLAWDGARIAQGQSEPGQNAPAQDEPALQPLHPSILLVDRKGVSVLKSGQPISTMLTCGKCHDTAFIIAHSYHGDLGRKERKPSGSTTAGHAWDYGPGPFGRWSSLEYRYLTPPGDRQLDLGVAEWIRRQGWRHVGGGPARFGHGDRLLDQRPGDPGDDGRPDPDLQVLNDAGNPTAWDWQASGTVAMNCFLCHLPQPDNQSRIAELEAGNFRWANTATLGHTPIVQHHAQGWTYDKNQFQADGTVPASSLDIQIPTSNQCGQCHGQTYFSDRPLELKLTLRNWATATKGQVFSPQKISASALNLHDKNRLTRPWDVHAESLLQCTSCHFSLNQPAAYEPSPRSRPRHLIYEPRRLSIDQYLRRPNHQFAKGHTAQGTTARQLDGTMRTCQDCHDAKTTHDWLPYSEVHFARLRCEACHIPASYAPALKEIDWTMLDQHGQPRIVWRGIHGDPARETSPITGFRPVLLPHADLDGQSRLTPYNLVTATYWVTGGESPRPVREHDLKAALLIDGTEGTPRHFQPAIVAALDSDHDGQLSPAESRLDQPEKIAAVRARLQAVGVTDAKIVAEIQPFGLHHGVGPAQWATRQCETCHQARSRLTEPFVLAANLPAGIAPTPVGDCEVRFTGQVRADRLADSNGTGEITYIPSTRKAGLYVLGHDRWTWITVLGSLAIVSTLLAVAGHAFLRIRSARRTNTPPPDGLSS